MRISVLLLFVTACSSVSIYAPGMEEGIEAAMDAGLHVRVGDEHSLMSLEERPSLKASGHAYDRHGCKRSSYVGSDAKGDLRAVVIAHEIGHMMGLNHVNDPRNLMNPKVTEDFGFLTSEQRKISKRTRAFMKTCELIQ